jgi:large subunit ribosomal protein L21e
MKLTKRIKDKGMPKVNEYLKQFEIGDLAAVSIEPCHNFQGRTGRITGKQGRCYILTISVGSVVKKIIADPVHLKKISGVS